MTMKFDEQLRIEQLGADAALAGRDQDTCPYAPRSSEEAHWRLGYDVAAHEKQVAATGMVMLYSTAENAKPFQVTVKQAVDLGAYKPRFVNPYAKSE